MTIRVRETAVVGPLVPHALAPGDRIAVVAPSHAVVPDRVASGVEALRGWGFEPVVMPHVHHQHGHLAGRDEDRLADLQEAFDDPTLRAVWIARGGSGLSRIVDRLDWARMGQDPKPIVGFSDVTTLLHAAWRRLGLVTFHAQFAGRAHLVDQHADAAAHLRGLLAGTVGPGRFPWLEGVAPPAALIEGRAEGPLVGGNLTVLAAGIGTPWQLDTAGAVLFLEDVGEAPYRIDRSLTQLRAAGLLADVAGVVVGTFVGCEPPATRPSATTAEVVGDHLGDLAVPVLVGVPIGHVDRQLALPHGARVALDAGAGTLELREPSVAR